MNLKKLTLIDGTTIAVNTEYVVGVEPGGEDRKGRPYTRVAMAGGEKLISHSVTGSFHDVVGQLL
ncbi:hypothetical protein [Ensifer adhaerens]|uniref:hypothetical protein n=1 Tax=Ensifer adhaerens TaxID=106592 RepID=UPI001C4E0770|nr:hypothetical protein [Ensifer adhaerens]MBW0369537.1 hypothetical protein [Ensifer adhaerens]UCM21350.1 hypothetical protein LDL63_07180 [Ensifer adhaerens]